MDHRLYLLFPTVLVLLFLTGCPDGTPSEPGTVTFDDMEARAVDLVNAERKLYQLSQLKVQSDIRTAARLHSQDMAENNYFSHTNMEGLSFSERLENLDTSWKKAGENLAYNNNALDPAEAAVSSWINSPEHHDNLLTEDFTHTGIGVGLSEKGTYFFTQIFIGK
ncbi:MAG: CAP domain-containing protein [Candidatus Hydrogenedentes bacterium]|nr:CAP domain-containing protein [Candidatus Hydrogenedentota bacterium]